LTEVINYIGRNVKIGKNVRIWHFVYIGDNTEIGDNVKIGSLTHIDYNVKIGSNTKIEGLVYIPPLSIIGERVFIGPRVTLTNDPYPMSERLAGVVVEDDAVLCAGAIVKAGVRIGKNSVVGMGAVVTKDVPPDVVVYGVPAKQIYSRRVYDEKKLKWVKGLAVNTP